MGKASQFPQERDSLFIAKPSIKTVLSVLARFVRLTHSICQSHSISTNCKKKEEQLEERFGERIWNEVLGADHR